MENIPFFLRRGVDGANRKPGATMRDRRRQDTLQNTLLIVHGDKPFVLISRVSIFSLVAPSIIKQKNLWKKTISAKDQALFFSNSVNEQYLIVREVSLV